MTCSLWRAGVKNFDAIVNDLAEHYGNLLLGVHGEEPPGAERTGELNSAVSLAGHMPILGREESYLCCIVFLARVWRHWRQRSDCYLNVHRRGLAHLLVIGCPGSGKADQVFLGAGYQALWGSVCSALRHPSRTAAWPLHGMRSLHAPGAVLA